MGAAPSQDVLFGESEGEVLHVSCEQLGYPVKNVRKFAEITTMWYAGRATPAVKHFFEVRFDRPSTISAIEMSPLPDDSTLRMHRIVARAWVKHSDGGGHLGPWTELMPWRCSRQALLFGSQPCHTAGALAQHNGRVPLCGFEFFATDAPTWVITKSSKESVLYEGFELEQHAQVLSCFAPGLVESDGAGSGGPATLASLGEFGMLRVEVRHETKTTRGCLAEIGIVGFRVVGTASVESGAKDALDAAVAKITFGPGRRMSGNDGDEEALADSDTDADAGAGASLDSEVGEGEVASGGTPGASDGAAAARAKQREHMKNHGVRGKRDSAERGDSIVSEALALVKYDQLKQDLSTLAAAKKLSARRRSMQPSIATAVAAAPEAADHAKGETAPRAATKANAKAAVVAAATATAAAPAAASAADESNITRWQVVGSKIHARATAELPGTKSGGQHVRGEVVEVSSTLTKRVGAKKVRVTFLELANGKGWLFDRIARKPQDVLMEQLQE